MEISGIGGMSAAEVQSEIDRGARFVVFLFCVSLLIVTFKRPPRVYVIRPEQHAWLKGLPYVLLSLVLGWWGFPWGPLYTIESITVNLRGGQEVTWEVLPAARAASAAHHT